MVCGLLCAWHVVQCGIDQPSGVQFAVLPHLQKHCNNYAKSQGKYKYICIKRTFRISSCNAYDECHMMIA